MVNKWNIKDQDVYLTPDRVFDDFFSEYGIQLKKAYDPCPYPESEVDGLTSEWQSPAYVNPPFSQCRQWYIKAREQAKKGCEVYMLCPFYFIYNNRKRKYSGCDFDEMVTISSHKVYEFKSPYGLKDAKVTCHLVRLKNDKFT